MTSFARSNRQGAMKNQIGIWMIFLAVLLLFPCASMATGLWNHAPTATGKLGDSAKNCHPRENANNTCWYDVLQATASTLVTPILNLGRCENISYSWTGDITDNTATTNTIQCRELFCDTIDPSDECSEILNNSTLNGDPSTVGDDSADRGTDVGLFYCRATMAVAASTGRLRLSCWP